MTFQAPSALRLIAITIAICGAAALLGACSPEAGGNKPSLAAHAAAADAQPAPAAVARGKIDIEGGLLELAPATEGLVQQLLVREGQSVQKGQLLLRLADDSARADLSVAQSEVGLAQARLQASSARVAPLKATLTRWQTAAHEGAADAHSVNEAAQQLRDAQSQADIARAELKVAQSKLEQLRAGQKRLELHAPEAAVVVRLRTHAGSQAGPTASAMTLLPQRPLIVRAELNESFANAVRVGMAASVVLDGDTSAKAAALPPAKVVRISPVLGASHLQEDTQRGPIRVIECVLAFDQAPPAARVGQNVRVTFHE